MFHETKYEISFVNKVNLEKIKLIVLVVAGGEQEAKPQYTVVSTSMQLMT